MEQKQVKIIGLSVNKKFGGLEATELKLNPENKLTVVKGEVGSGKTTLNRALSIPTKGTKTLEDTKLYGSDVDLTAQLLDGDYNVFVNSKSDKNGKITHSIYTIDKDGNKLKDVVIDGSKLTPANYLKSLQTELTWRLDELTSENSTVQRNLLLELYSNELSNVGVVFDKKNPKYVGGIIDQIEKAKSHRSYMDMKRKEVGGIADDMTKKGIDFELRRELKPIDLLESEILTLKSKKSNAKTNLQQQRENELLTLKNKGSEIKQSLMVLNNEIDIYNEKVDDERDEYNELVKEVDFQKEKLESSLKYLLGQEKGLIKYNQICQELNSIKEPELIEQKKIQFNEKNQCTSKPEEFQDEKIVKPLKELFDVSLQYIELLKKPLSEVDTTELDSKIESLEKEIKSKKIWNDEANAINSFHNWQDANQSVLDLKQDYYLKLTEINTGVKGLHIIPDNDESGNIYLAYNGEYDPEYFHNTNAELRKLSAYSDTQKPMICLLVQKYLLSKKTKALPYLWIDKVPIDNRTRNLIERMSQELNLWLFVSWTGDFEKSNLQDGELLIENGEIFFK